MCLLVFVGFSLQIWWSFYSERSHKGHINGKWQKKIKRAHPLMCLWPHLLDFCSQSNQISHTQIPTDSLNQKIFSLLSMQGIMGNHPKIAPAWICLSATGYPSKLTCVTCSLPQWTYKVSDPSFSLQCGFFVRQGVWRAVALHQGRIMGKDDLQQQHMDADGFLIQDQVSSCRNRKSPKHWVTSWTETHWETLSVWKNKHRTKLDQNKPVLTGPNWTKTNQS